MLGSSDDATTLGTGKLTFWSALITRSSRSTWWACYCDKIQNHERNCWKEARLRYVVFNNNKSVNDRQADVQRGQRREACQEASFSIHSAHRGHQWAGRSGWTDHVWTDARLGAPQSRWRPCWRPWTAQGPAPRTHGQISLRWCGSLWHTYFSIFKIQNAPRRFYYVSSLLEGPVQFQIFLEFSQHFCNSSIPLYILVLKQYLRKPIGQGTYKNQMKYPFGQTRNILMNNSQKVNK